MAKIENMDEATARIEAALYSAGRPLRIEEYHQSLRHRIKNKDTRITQ